MKLRLLSAVLVFTLCWYVFEPVPAGFSQPWKLRALCTGIKLVLNLSWMAEALGITTFPRLLNSVDNFMYSASDGTRGQDFVFDGVPVRAYNLRRTEHGRQPALVYYHGGGWMVSSVDHYEGLMLRILKDVDLVIISVEYRRVGENGVKFPIPLEDCLAATKYFLSNTDVFGVDSGRIAIGGDSAGGNLAAAVALRLRDADFRPMPKLQALIYPALQSVDFLLPSMVQNADGPLLKRYWMAWFWAMYATGSADYASEMVRNRHTSPAAKSLIYHASIKHEHIEMDYHYAPYRKPRLDFGDERLWAGLSDVMMNPYYAPLLADDVSRLPETYVYTVRHDAIRDDGLLFVRRLKDAGVRTTLVEDPDAFHGACSYRRWFPREGERCVNDLTAFLKTRL